MELLLFRPSQLAFLHAIEAKKLSKDARKKTYVGNYMYMGTEYSNGRYTDQFKHVDTRSYLYILNDTPPHIDQLKCCPDDPEGIEYAKEKL